MGDPRVIEGTLSGDGRRFGLAAARFNGTLVDQLLAGAVDCLQRHGTAPEGVEVVRVPGAWELPVALEWLAASGRFHALVALGVVLRGDTPHFDYICRESSRGVARVMERYGIPVAFGLLTCDTVEQAAARAGGKAGNKGWEAALAALEMADLRSRLTAAD
ncbi:MAG TPA: 6,7-dimethyl-8-ribityllumazine synthase [Thermoanaerobaculia bacterium]|jgi:6,7-dimethyl-8-ribityllumazine synthase|nr:6,7-dimethyl-8-ribityllumazine synthase [Thermoanaerobaculia bacterium]